MITGWHIAHAQHIGARDEQQDRVAAFMLAQDDNHLCVLADGMGGHPRGAEAAQAVIDAAAAVEECLLEDPFGVLERVLDTAHRRIQNLGSANASPGSTCVVALLSGAEAFWAHVGDSRLYQFRRGTLIRTTEDHSLAVLVAKRRGSAAPAPASNAVYRRLGSTDHPIPDYDAVEVDPGDILMLASDGFWDLFSADELAARLARGVPHSQLLESLVEEAVTRGGASADNASVLTASWNPTVP